MITIVGLLALMQSTAPVVQIPSPPPLPRPTPVTRPTRMIPAPPPPPPSYPRDPQFPKGNPNAQPDGRVAPRTHRPPPPPILRARPTVPPPRPDAAAPPQAQLSEPRLPEPRGNPETWVTMNDYPASALRDRLEGAVEYRLIVGTNGRVSQCMVTSSSGHAVLDEATCRTVQRRARFIPAVSDRGQPVSGNWSALVNWRLPE